MSQIASIGAGLFSDISVCVDIGAGSDTETLIDAIAAGTQTETNFKDCFAVEIAVGTAAGAAGTGEFNRIKNVREFPAIGTPPNVVNVPVYGSKTSQQIQGQADAPSIELSLNFVGDDWQDAADYLGEKVGDGLQYVFRFALLNAEPSAYASVVGEIGSVENSQYFWIGKMEALLVNPQLTDANTATATITVQSDFYGAFTD
jgi:hypothetical protein